MMTWQEVAVAIVFGWAVWQLIRPLLPVRGKKKTSGCEAGNCACSDKGVRFPASFQDR
ncbi:MAG: hypothetical protein LPK46_12080 [Bacteroidota bacterium]|nr:hypothetical protein [Bacteroidota bacterium]MDX5429243.1 hypothetical protein [Bacteroidota bacterium]MDX5447503.1 hypothetical protein [Bacteroidota bacterium]MDX5506865.1 hypothetical protein [Bacteroidota bacterium]